MNHDYTWHFEEDEVPEELHELTTATYKGYTFEIGDYDGDLFGAVDGFEFVVGWARGGYEDAAEVLELNPELEGTIGHELAAIVAEVTVLDDDKFNELFDH